VGWYWILFNRVSSGSVSVQFVRASPAATVPILTTSLGANNRTILEPITLTAGDKLQGMAAAGMAVDFTASGVVKDL
jgi:hypothetical protein